MDYLRYFVNTECDINAAKLYRGRFFTHFLNIMTFIKNDDIALQIIIKNFVADSDWLSVCCKIF